MTDTKKPNATPNATDDALRRAAEMLQNRERTNTREARLDAALKKATIKDDGVFAWMRDTAADIKVIADTIRTAKRVCGWIGDKYSNGVDAVKGLPYVGPAVTWPFQAIPSALYRFCHPHKDETFMQAFGKSLTYPFRYAGNAIGNVFRDEKKLMAEDTRERIRSVPRIGVATLMSAWALSSALSVPVLGDSFDYLVMDPPADAFRMAVTATANVAIGDGFGMTTETLYCGLPTKSDKDDVTFVTCGVKEADGTFAESGQTPFVARPGRLLSEVYSWTHGHGPHDPGRITGVIKPDLTKCEVTYYGTRMRLAKWANFYPEFLNASCKPAESASGRIPLASIQQTLPSIVASVPAP